VKSKAIQRCAIGFVGGLYLFAVMLLTPLFAGAPLESVFTPNTLLVLVIGGVLGMFSSFFWFLLK